MQTTQPADLWVLNILSGISVAVHAIDRIKDDSRSRIAPVFSSWPFSDSYSAGWNQLLENIVHKKSWVSVDARKTPAFV